MNRGVCAVALAVAGAMCWAQDETEQHQSALGDGVAAYVNESVITISDVLGEIRRSLKDVSDLKERERLMRAMYKVRINTMVDCRLILDYAKKMKVSLQPWAVESRVREIVANTFDGDQTKLYDLLSDRKISVEEWKRVLEEDLLLNAMRYQYVDKRVSVTPSEIRAEYEANKSRYQTESAVAVSLIVLDPPDGDAEPTVEARAEAIAAALKEGTSFADLARKYSRDSKAANGGSWGKINPEVFHEELVEALALLKPGEVSPLIVVKEYGYIIRKDDQQDSRVLTFEEVAPYVEGRLKLERSEKMFKEWTTRLRNEAYIRILELPGTE